MLVLGIDCSTKWTNVGVSDSGAALAEINLELGRAQSSELPLLVDRVLSEAGADMRGLGLIAVANGPGYYTGIRTGVAYAAALARSLGIKVVPLSTTELFVFDLRYLGKPLAPIIKARRDSVYAALYSSDTISLDTLVPPSFISAADFAETLRQYPDAILTGADAANYPELACLPNEINDRASSSGRQAALMGWLYRKNAVSPGELRGNYLRKPDIGPN